LSRILQITIDLTKHLVFKKGNDACYFINVLFYVELL